MAPDGYHPNTATYANVTYGPTSPYSTSISSWPVWPPSPPSVDTTPRALATSRGRIQCPPELRIDDEVLAVEPRDVADRPIAWFVAKQGATREKKPGRRRVRTWEVTA